MERFVQANYKFAVCPFASSHQPGFFNPDEMVAWRDVQQVFASYAPQQQPRCPICLETPRCPRMTRCGHVFCFCCILRTLDANDACPCPICKADVCREDLRAVRVTSMEPPQEGRPIGLRLVRCEAGTLCPFTGSTCRSRLVSYRQTRLHDRFQEVGHAGIAAFDDEFVAPFCRVVLCSPESVLEDVAREQAVLQRFRQDCMASGDISWRSYVAEAFALLESRRTNWNTGCKMKDAVKRVRWMKEHNLESDRTYTRDGTDDDDARAGQVHVAAPPRVPEQTNDVRKQTLQHTEARIGAVADRGADGEDVAVTDGETPEDNDPWDSATSAPLPPPPPATKDAAGEALSDSTVLSHRPVPSEAAVPCAATNGGSGDGGGGGASVRGDDNVTHFYQASDGELVMLDPLTAKLLLHSVNDDPWSLPHTLTARVEEAITVKVTMGTRRRYPFLRHLPMMCEVVLVLLDLPQDALDASTWEKYGAELAARKAEREQQRQNAKQQHTRDAAQDAAEQEQARERMREVFRRQTERDKASIRDLLNGPGLAESHGAVSSSAAAGLSAADGLATSTGDAPATSTTSTFSATTTTASATTATSATAGRKTKPARKTGTTGWSFARITAEMGHFPSLADATPPRSVPAPASDAASGERGDRNRATADEANEEQEATVATDHQVDEPAAAAATATATASAWEAPLGAQSSHAHREEKSGSSSSSNNNNKKSRRKQKKKQQQNQVFSNASRRG